MTFFIHEFVVLSGRVIGMIYGTNHVTFIKVVSFYELVMAATPVDKVIVNGGLVERKSKH